MNKRMILLNLISLFWLFTSGTPAFAINTPNSFHFQAVPSASLVCNATTTTSFEQFAAGAKADAPDIVIRNIGTTPVYFEIGLGGASVVATVPTSGSYGSQVINPGEADLLSKTSADTVACITSTSTGTLVITPGTGN